MKKLLIIGIVFICCSCNYNQGENDISRTQIREEISVMMGNYLTDLNKNGMESQMKYMDNSDDFRWTYSNYRRVYLFDDMAQQLNKSENEGYSAHLTFDELEIIPISENIANYTAKLSGFTKFDGKNSDVSILESGTLIKRKDGWKFLNGQTALYDNVL